MLKTLMSTALLMTSFATPTFAQEIEFLASDKHKASGLPFSEAVRVGDILFLSGQVGTDASGKLVSGGIQAEAEQILKNIDDVVTRFGSDKNHIFKCLVMLKDISEWPAFNEVYVKYFDGNKPARSAFAGSGLALDAVVEVECMATVKK